METNQTNQTTQAKRMKPQEAALTPNEAAYKEWLVDATPAELAGFLANADRGNRVAAADALLVVRIAEYQSSQDLENTNAVVAALAELGKKVDALGQKLAALAQLKVK